MGSVSLQAFALSSASVAVPWMLYWQKPPWLVTAIKFLGFHNLFLFRFAFLWEEKSAQGKDTTGEVMNLPKPWIPWRIGS